MPDQSSAANEHAILQEISAPLATLPDDSMPEVAEVHFPVALRGYDRLAVDAYVKKTSQLVAELQATRSPEAAIRRALERVGEEVSGILKRAHETAGEITAQSRREAEDRLEVARREAAQIVAVAHQQLKDLDSDTDRIWGERHRIVNDTRGLAQELLALAQSAGDRFPEAEAASESETQVDAELEPDLEEMDEDPELRADEPDLTEPMHEPEPEDDQVTAVLPPPEFEPDGPESDETEPDEPESESDDHAR